MYTVANVHQLGHLHCALPAPPEIRHDSLLATSVKPSDQDGSQARSSTYSQQSSDREQRALLPVDERRRSKPSTSAVSPLRRMKAQRPVSLLPPTPTPGVTKPSLASDHEPVYQASAPYPIKDHADRAASTKDLDRLAMCVAKSSLLQSAIQSGYPDSSSVATPATTRRYRFDLNLRYPTITKDLCIVDSKISGHPVRATSATLKYGTRSLKIGECVFFNIPYGRSSEWSLELEPCVLADMTTINTKFYLEWKGALVDSSSQRTMFACGQIDVSREIRQIAAYNDAEMSAAHRPRRAANDNSHTIDWAEVASAKDEHEKSEAMRQRSCIEVTDRGSSRAGTRMSLLRPDTLSPASVAFVKAVEDVKVRYKSYFVLAPTKKSRIPLPPQRSKVGHRKAFTPHLQTQPTHSIMYISPLLASLPTDAGENLKYSSRETVESLRTQWSQSEYFETRVKWTAKRVDKLLCSVPLISKEGGDDSGCWWICFVVNEN